MLDREGLALCWGRNAISSSMDLGWQNEAYKCPKISGHASRYAVLPTALPHGTQTLRSLGFSPSLAPYWGHSPPGTPPHPISKTVDK